MSLSVERLVARGAGLRSVGTAGRRPVVTDAARIVKDTMIGMRMPDAARWSERVSVVLGLNPGPFTGPGTNTYLIGTGEQRLLLDTGQGVDGYLPLLEASITGVAGARGLAGIVITHGHVDHIGGVGALLDRFGTLPVYGMSLDVRTLAGAVAIGDGAVVSTEGATLRALWTPGHAADHLCFYLEEERALFTGDVVLGAGTTVIPRDGDLAQYLDSLQRLLQLDLAVIYPAHGPAIREPYAKIREYIAHRQLRETQIVDALTGGAKKVAEIVALLYTDVPAYLHPAAAMSVEAHLRKLSREGRAASSGEHWRRT